MKPLNFSQADVLPISREWLLSRASEKEIMDYYLGGSHNFGETFRSPFRKDRNPSCVLFVSSRGRIMYRDWTEGKPIDCFDVARRIRGRLHFGALLKQIAVDMGLLGKPAKSIEILKQEKEDIMAKAKSQKADIRVQIQPWQQEDRRYLEQFGLNDTRLLEHFQVFSPKYVWLYGEPFYSWSWRDPALAYYFGKASDGSERWKIHFYKRRDGLRFLGNTSRIAGWIQLPRNGNLCVLTKSLKDVMCLATHDIPAISMQGEMTLPYPNIIEELRERFANLYSLYDFDMAGITSANKLRKLYGIEALFLTNGRFGTRDFGSKDFSDFIRDHTAEEVNALLREAVQHTGVKLTQPYEFEDDEPPFDIGDTDSQVHDPRRALEEASGGILEERADDPEEVRGVSLRQEWFSAASWDEGEGG